VEPVQTAPDEVTAKVAFGEGSRANVLCYLKQGAGMLYAIAAPKESFSESRAVLVKILQSFRYTTPSDGAAESNGPVGYTTWSDPKEGAFSVEVPEGWKVIGGLYRLAPIDVRRQVNLISPDGEIQIQAGDARVSAYVPYGPSAQVRGLHEEQSYQVNGITYTVLHYMGGAEYSKKYIEAAVRKDHPDLSIGDSKDRPDLQRWAEQKLRTSQVSVGETDFTYNDQGRAYQGAVIGITADSGQGLSELWQGIPSTVCATSGKMPQGQEVLTHLLKNTTDSVTWSAKQRETTQQFTQLVMQNHERAMAELRETYDRFTRWLGENQREWSNILNNQVDVRDASGSTFKVEAGHNYYWSSPQGIVGTQSSNAPDISLTPLTKF